MEVEHVDTQAPGVGQQYVEMLSAKKDVHSIIQGSLVAVAAAVVWNGRMSC